ncbi:hypothetical protein CI610_02833 [invertebrate metagenome]|uniref:Reverse transcriptase/retrotransposon-derived protein RNase H-like domain-containing protein n=1 Tax=invertebrate metagenome TaxID=1711999 RepID=A0A2H9T4T0_9ZZZZ
MKKVRQFLGFCGYYRRFIKDFAKIAQPLNQLLQSHDLSKSKTKSKSVKKADWVWSDSQQEAFDSTKSTLTQPPVLAYADYSKPFILHTDASASGLGAILYQVQDGKERVIAYASRGLRASERNYPAHKFEFLALKWTVTDKLHD